MVMTDMTGKVNDSLAYFHRLYSMYGVCIKNIIEKIRHGTEGDRYKRYRACSPVANNQNTANNVYITVSTTIPMFVGILAEWLRRGT